MKIFSCIASIILLATTCVAQVQLPSVYGSLTYPKVLKEGREPRRELRYEPAMGLVDKVELTVRQKMAAKATDGTANKSMNKDETLRFTLIAEVAKQAKGETELAIEVLGVVVANPDLKPAELRSRNEALMKLKGVKGTFVVKRNGVVSSTQISAEASADEETSKALEELKNNFQQLFPILPPGLIGPGGSWALRAVGADPTAAKGKDKEKELTYIVQGGPKDRIVVAGSAAWQMTPKELGLDRSGLPVTDGDLRMTTTAEYVLMDGRALPFKVASTNKGSFDLNGKDPSSGKSVRGDMDLEQAVTLKQLPLPAGKNPK